MPRNVRCEQLFWAKNAGGTKRWIVDGARPCPVFLPSLIGSSHSELPILQAKQRSSSLIDPVI
jgi:hypothetical protein